MRRDRDERWEGGKEKIFLVRFPDTLVLGPQPAKKPSLAVSCDGTGRSLVDSSIPLHPLADVEGYTGFSPIMVDGSRLRPQQTVALLPLWVLAPM